MVVLARTIEAMETEIAALKNSAGLADRTIERLNDLAAENFETAVRYRDAVLLAQEYFEEHGLTDSVIGVILSTALGIS